MVAPLLLLLSTSSSSRQSLIRPLSAYLHIPIKSYGRSSSSQHGIGEKGTSTAEEFQRVAAEKRKQQGSAEEKSGQTSEVFEESNHQTVKEKHKEASGFEESKGKGD